MQRIVCGLIGHRGPVVGRWSKPTTAFGVRAQGVVPICRFCGEQDPVGLDMSRFHPPYFGHDPVHCKSEARA